MSGPTAPFSDSSRGKAVGRDTSEAALQPLQQFHFAIHNANGGPYSS
jgi:hypothetical protein